MQVQSLGREDPLEEEMATHPSTPCLGNPMDRRATVPGVAKSQTAQQNNESGLWPVDGEWTPPREQKWEGQQGDGSPLRRSGRDTCAPEASEAACPAPSLCSYPRRPGLSFRLWWKLQLSAFWELCLVLAVRDPLIWVNLFLFSSWLFWTSHLENQRNLKVYLIWWLRPLPVLKISLL